MRISLRVKLLCFASIVLPACAPPPGPSPVPPQTTYARTPGETLRYHDREEWSTSRGLVGMPPVDSFKTVRDGRFAIRFTARETARIWFESLRMEEPEQPPETAGADVLGRPLVVRMGPLGIDSILGTPGFERPWSEVELRIRTFLPRLPSGPWTPGREWEESARIDESDAEWEGGHTRTAQYRAVGDSVIRGVAVRVLKYDLEIDGDRRLRNSGRYELGRPEIPPYGESTFQQETGRLYFDPAAGRLVRHTRTGVRSESRTSYHTEAATQVKEYSRTLELLSP